MPLTVSLSLSLTVCEGLVVLVRTMTVSWAGYRAAKLMFEGMLGSLLRAPQAWLDKNPSGRILNRMSDDQAKIDCVLPFAFGSIFGTPPSKQLMIIYD